jgi:dTDP-4-dehydrorhamnose reductase
MKILILGSSGMLGHQLWLYLGEKYNVFGTTRNEKSSLNEFKSANRILISGIDANKIDNIKLLIKREKFDLIINCIGVIKQLKEVNNWVSTIYTNSLFPHMVAEWADQAKVIHISTDCVFSGLTGNYTENDLPDAKDLYGRSKMMGEINYFPHLTLRTSIIGHELKNKVSLLDWFLAQNGKVKGYSNAIYSGVTTLELSKQIDFIIQNFFELTGIWQLSSEPINKFDLLRKISVIYEKEIFIERDELYTTNKSLSYSMLTSEIGYKPTDWDTMLKELNIEYRKLQTKLYDN